MKIKCCYCGVFLSKGIFTIPSNNPAIEDEWKKIIPGCEELMKINKNLPLCYNHFAEADVIKEDIFSINGKSVSVPRMIWGLRPNSVPCIFNDKSSSFGASPLFSKRGTQQDGSIKSTKDFDKTFNITTSFAKDSSTMTINSNNTEVPVQKSLLISALQSQVFFKPSSIDKSLTTGISSNPPVSAEIPTTNERILITREGRSRNQKATTLGNTIGSCCDVEDSSVRISTSSVSRPDHENLSVKGITPTPVCEPIVGVFVMIPNSIKLPGENWYSIRGAEQILFCCEVVFKGEISVIRKGAKIDVKTKSISYFVYQDALPVDKELPRGLYRYFETVNSLNETLKIFDALPLCTGVDNVPYRSVKDCSTIFGVFKNGVWRSNACAVFPDSLEVQGLCSSCCSFKQSLLYRYIRQRENPTTSVTNKRYVGNKNEIQNEIKFLKQKLKRTETRLMEKEVELRSMREEITKVQKEMINVATNKRVKTNLPTEA